MPPVLFCIGNCVMLRRRKLCLCTRKGATRVKRHASFGIMQKSLTYNYIGGIFMWKKYKPYIISVLFALGVGGLSAFLTRNSMNIYQSINKPPLSPPGWLFPIVWTILFTLMGISSARIYIKGKEKGVNVSAPLKTYLWQLGANFIWSLLFFNRRQFLLSFFWIIALWWLIYTMIKQFKEIDPLAAKLQIPYLLWVTFAGYLNFMIWVLNM